MGFVSWTVRRISLYSIAALVGLYVGFPLVWMCLTAFKPSNEILAYPPTLFPRHPTVQHFERLFQETNFGSYFVNSLLVSLSAVIFSLVLSSVAAFAMSKLEFKGKGIWSIYLLMTYMFTPIFVAIPFYVLAHSWGILDSRIGLILAYVSFCLPLCIWLLKDFYDSAPADLLAAARVDGADDFHAFLLAFLPISAPGLAAVGVFTWIIAWNDFIFARVLTSTDKLKTLPVGIQDMFRSSTTDWGLIMAASFLATLPMLVIFLSLRKYFVRGWGVTGLKG